MIATIANLVARRLDNRLAGLSERHGFTYTHYADDLSFSGKGIEQARVRRAIEFIIRDSGFAPNDGKTAHLSRATRQRVTGLVVNDQLNWPRDTHRWLRQEIYYLEKFGHEAHAARRGYHRSLYREFIYGHVFALYSVRPEEAVGYLERLDRMSWRYG